MDIEGQYLSPPGESYTPANVQRQFAGLSPRDVYALLTKRTRCKCIQTVMKMLPERVQGWDDIKVIDLDRTYVGPKGALVIFELCKVLGSLHTIRVSNNYLENESIWALCKMAMFHPSLSTIDVSGNDISWTAGMSLLELTAKNTLIQHVNVFKTLVKSSVIELIQIQTRRNVTLQNRSLRRGPNPNNHPLSIRLRSLKRFFLELAQREGSKDELVPKKCVIDGVEEMWKLSGREGDIKQRSPQYFEAIASRAPTDWISWEIFLLLVMGVDVSFHPQFVSRLRFVFNTFDVDGAGYVEAKDLRDMMACLTDGAQPSESDVVKKKSLFDLDDTMSVQWEEFLLMMCDLGPVKGTSVMFIDTPILGSGCGDVHVS